MMEISIDKRIKTYKGSSRLIVKTNIEPLSVTKVFGPSGVGKTTFLKILAGLISPENGMIKMGDELWLDTGQRICRSPQQRKVGFVFQDYALFPNMTVMDHLLYATPDKPLIERLLEIGKMETFIKHRPNHLSGGQQQRLAILRALATAPKVLLMDEAFSALDDDLRESLIEDIKILLKEFGTTTFIVSHHLQETVSFTGSSLKIELD